MRQPNPSKPHISLEWNIWGWNAKRMPSHTDTAKLTNYCEDMRARWQTHKLAHAYHDYQQWLKRQAEDKWAMITPHAQPNATTRINAMMTDLAHTHTCGCGWIDSGNDLSHSRAGSHDPQPQWLALVC